MRGYYIGNKSIMSKGQLEYYCAGMKEVSYFTFENRVGRTNVMLVFKSYNWVCYSTKSGKLRQDPNVTYYVNEKDGHTFYIADNRGIQHVWEVE